MTTPLYPFDVTGSASTNLIVNETHDLKELIIGPTKINPIPYQILLPAYVPFYENRFMLKHMSSSGTLTDLVKDTDYKLILQYLEASKSIGSNIFGGILLLTPFTDGTFKIYYQTLGGDWIADTQHVVDRINEKHDFNPTHTSLDVLTDKTNVFPIVNHDYHDDFTVGHDELLASINNIIPEIIKGHGNTLIDVEHFIDVKNPHHVTKAQVGLPDIVDYPPATLVEARDLATVDKYITSITLNEVVLSLAKKVTVTGPTTLATNAVGSFTIINYYSFVKYDVTSIGGKATVKGNKVIYKAPGITGLYGFTINGVKVNVTIT